MQAVAAHICYVLAGVHTQPFDPASKLCLVGANHRTHPRRFASIPALQRSEVLEWARSQGTLMVESSLFSLHCPVSIGAVVLAVG